MTNSSLEGIQSKIDEHFDATKNAFDEYVKKEDELKNGRACT